MQQHDKFSGCLVGLAVGDAVGATLEFRPRGSFTPIGDMVGGGPFGLPPGAWTDDTSMALCLATSLVEKQGFDAQDQMERYWRWHQDGYLSSTGRCFDIGNATRAALVRFHQAGDPFSGSTEPHSAGNGSIMRLGPVPMYYSNQPEQAIFYAGESSRTTHAAVECIDACKLLAAILVAALAGHSKSEILFGSYAAADSLSTKIAALAGGAYRDKAEAQIRGSGYVVESLEAALWCFWTTDTYRAAILRAANLGDDTDTTAAICGQVAGAYYGLSGIPDQWVAKLVMGDAIQQLAADLDQNHRLA